MPRKELANQIIDNSSFFFGVQKEAAVQDGFAGGFEGKAGGNDHARFKVLQ